MTYRQMSWSMTMSKPKKVVLAYYLYLTNARKVTTLPFSFLHFKKNKTIVTLKTPYIKLKYEANMFIVFYSFYFIPFCNRKSRAEIHRKKLLHKPISLKILNIYLCIFHP